jgi:SHS2 domain-containing protein
MAERRIEFQKIARGKLTGIRVEAPSLQRVFLDAGLAFFDSLVTVSRQSAGETERRKIEIHSTDPKSLFREWAKKLRSLYVDEKFIASRAVFEKFDGKAIVAVLHGAAYNSMTHGAFHSLGEITADNALLTTEGPDDKPFAAEICWPV